MYCSEPTYGGAPALSMGNGLGALPVTAYVVGQGGSAGINPCDDTLFRITHQEECAVMALPAPQPQPQAPAPYIPPPVPYQQPAPIIQTFDQAAPEPLTALAPAPVEGGGLWFDISSGGGGAPAPVTVDVTTTGPEAPPPARGFGMVEAGMAALLALLVAGAWKTRERR